MKFKLDPLTLKQIRRFKSIKRGYYSFLILCLLLVFCVFAEMFINSRALVVHYEGKTYFPTYGKIYPGTTFGLDYDYETNYRDLQKKFKEEGGKNFVLMPLVPYNEYENDFKEGSYPPFGPSFADRHFLGTDTAGRDILARLVFGFRIAIIFSLILLICDYVIGITIGCLMGYYGGWFDILVQRIIEIWADVPFLYVVMIVSSIMVPNFFSLIGIMVFFGWMGVTWQFRTQTYRQKAREYISAAKSLGASDARIIFKHIIPNSVSLIVTFIPFAISGGIVGLTSLDYLGFGLPSPTPSWGELLHQGTQNLSAGWIVSSVVCAMILVLVMVTFIGEAIREAFDPKRHTTYE